jgi:hypothetical protein
LKEFSSLNLSMLNLVKRFGLDGKSHARTPMSTNVKIST